MRNKNREVKTVNAMVGEFLLTPYCKCLCFADAYDWASTKVKVSLLYNNCILTESRIDIDKNYTYSWSILWNKYTNTDKKTNANVEKYLGYTAKNIFLFFSNDCPQWIKDFARTLYLK